MKSKFLAYMLWFFFGSLGAHKFYVGKPAHAFVRITISLICAITPFAGIGLLAILIIDLFFVGSEVDFCNMKKLASMNGNNTIVVNVPQNTPPVQPIVQNTPPVQPIVQNTPPVQPIVQNTPPVQPIAQSKMTDEKIEMLKKLAEMKQSGILSEDEFNEQKKIILSQ